MRLIVAIGAVAASAVLILTRGFTDEAVASILALVLLGGAVFWTTIPAAERSSSHRVRAVLYLFSIVWLVCAAYPLWKLVHPGEAIARVSLESPGDVRSFGELEPGRYVLLAEMPRTSVASVTDYTFIVENAGRSERFSGEFTRVAFRARAGRRGRARTESIHSADYHDVVLSGGDARIRLASLTGASHPLSVEVHGQAAPHGVWLGLQGAVVLLALVLDGLFSSRKRRSHMTVGAVFAALFVESARLSIRPGHMWKPIVGAGIVALLGGLALGSVLAWLAGRMAASIRGRGAPAPARGMQPDASGGST